MQGTPFMRVGSPQPAQRWVFASLAEFPTRSQDILEVLLGIGFPTKQERNRNYCKPPDPEWFCISNSIPFFLRRVTYTHQR